MTTTNVARPVNGRRAFSLLELVVVLVIIGIVSAVAMPMHGRSLARYRVESAARRLVADLDLARSRARATSQPVPVLFQLSTGVYAMATVRDPDTGSVPYVVDLTREPYRAAFITADFDDPGTAADNVNEVVFDGYGRCDSSGTVVLLFGEEKRTVVLDAESGQAVIQ